MKKNKKELAEMEKQVAEMQQLTDTIMKDIKYLKKVNSKIKIINKNVQELMDFYQKDWINCYEIIPEAFPDKHYPILNQDLVYETITDHYNELKKLLKLTAKFM